MMKKSVFKVGIASGLMALLVAGTAAAAFSDPITIQSVQVWPGTTPSTYLRFNGTLKGSGSGALPPDCAKSGLYLLVGSGTVENAKAMAALATAAFLAGKSVQVNFESGCAGGADGRISIISMQ